MTEQTRRNVLKYGIAVDLVILAAGVGMLLPPSPAILVAAFAFATTLAVVRGGWQGALTAGVLSLFALAGIFPDVIRPAHLVTFMVSAIAGSTALTMALRPRIRFQMPAPAIAAAAAPIAVPSEPEPEEAELSFAERPLERSSNLAEVVQLTPAPQPVPAPEPEPEKKPSKRALKQAKEEARRAKDLEERLAREREQAARIEAERIAAEEARQRAEEERQRIARELEEKLAREREEAARIEAERIAAEEARQRAEEERQRIARELEEKLAREREEAARIEAERIAAEEARQRAEEERRRIAREMEEKLAREREEAARIEAERIAAEEARQRAEAERQRIARELEDRLAREREQARLEAERIEAQRRAAEDARRAADEDRVRIAKELEQQLAQQREEARREQARIEEARAALEERLEKERQEKERLAKELEERQNRDREEAARLELERRAAEEARIRAEADRLRVEAELQERLAQERQATERDLHERLEAERKAAEEDLRRQLEAERERAATELAAEREKIEREASERIAAAQRAAEAATTNARPAAAAATPSPKAARTQAESKSLLGTITGWFKREPVSGKNVNLKTKRLTTNTATKRPQSAPPSAATTQRKAAPGKPRLLFIERRRGTVDTVVPKLRHRNVELEVVERWVDAVDEIFRFRPNALFLDVEHPEFDKIHKTLTDKTSQIPIVLTGRSIHGVPAGVRYAAFVQRPYDIDELSRLAQTAYSKSEDLLAEQSIPRDMLVRPSPAPHPVASRPHAPAPRPAAPAPAPQHTSVPAVHEKPAEVEEPPRPVRIGASTNEEYEVACFTCRASFNAVDADWCSCLAKERSLVCTNCLACFCKAPPAYKERFWVEAPPRLFERKTTEARRQDGTLAPNATKDHVTRPLVLTVEDDEEIQAIVQRVCSNLGYGFIWATNGQDGLDLAREYRPNLILSDAFMPKLDGREMCRILKEEPMGADIRMIVMTGLYTDTKYRSEAVKRFHVDDYIAKPVAITDLINLLQKHLEGVSGLPSQEDLHELHRKDIELEETSNLTLPQDEDLPLADLLAPAPKPRRADAYDVACFNCQLTFDATRAEWCSCVGRDNTLVCEHCSGCFCKAPAAYRERFWIDAPPSLFERKMIGSKRALTNGHNPPAIDVKRPLILLVEDDENVQLIVRTVVSSMGYGFVVGANGQEGLSLAREYNPDLILSDAFMPKLDGREMCRLLKEDPSTSRAKAIIMTGLYTDRKYRNEALDYFKVDDYVAKPLAVDDLIKLFKKHLPQEVTTTH